MVMVQSLGKALGRQGGEQSLGSLRQQESIKNGAGTPPAQLLLPRLPTLEAQAQHCFSDLLAPKPSAIQLFPSPPSFLARNATDHC